MSDFLVGHTKSQLDGFKYAEALKAAKAALENAPDSVDAQVQLAVVHFVMQNFSEAYKYFKMANQKSFAGLLEISRRYQWRRNGLVGDEAIEVLKKLNHRQSLRSYFFVYNAKIKSPSDHAHLVKEMLKLNNRIKKINFKYDFRKKHLDLSGNSQLRFLEVQTSSSARRYNILSSLPLKTVNLKGTKVNQTEAKSLINFKRIKVTWN